MGIGARPSLSRGTKRNCRALPGGGCGENSGPRMGTRGRWSGTFLDGVEKMKWLKASLFSQAILALYFQVMQWLPLGRWNYQPGFTPFGVQVMHGDASGQDFLLLVAFVMPFLAFWVAYSNDLRWLMWLGGVGYGLWLALQIKTWWIAYAYG